MIDEGSQLEMTELVLQEKEIAAKLAVLDQRLAEPETRLAQAKQLLLRAKAAYESILEEVRPLRSDQILLQGELERVQEAKSKLRVEARVLAGGGIRPGTQAFVEQMNEVAGDPEEARIAKATRELDLDAALAALKQRSGDGG